MSTVLPMFTLQVEGLRNEYNRVTSGASSKTSSSVGHSGTKDVSQLQQEAQQLQASVFCSMHLAWRINQLISIGMCVALLSAVYVHVYKSKPACKTLVLFVCRCLAFCFAISKEWRCTWVLMFHGKYLIDEYLNIFRVILGALTTTFVLHYMLELSLCEHLHLSSG